jgi:hypothetical protein
MVQTPGFYTGTLVLSISLLAVLVILCSSVWSNAKMREHLGLFTVVFTVGSLVIMTSVYKRILEAEKMMYADRDADRVYDVAPCPDAYILDQDTGGCKGDKETTLTLGSETLDVVTAGQAVVYKPVVSDDLDMATEDGITGASDVAQKLNAQGIKRICSNRLQNGLSYAELRPFCNL